MRYVKVSVGVIYDEQRRFLLFCNPNWKHRYAFCMKKKAPASTLDYGEIALVALDEECPLEFPEATVEPLEIVRRIRKSDNPNKNENTVYEYHVFQLDPGPISEASSPACETMPFSYEELMESEDVTWSTKEIAQAMLKTREVVLAIITRTLRGKREFLLVDKPPRGYFFPCVRRKTDANPEDAAVQAVRLDTGYDGPIEATMCNEFPYVQPSERFGRKDKDEDKEEEKEDKNVEFRFDICRVDLSEVDLADDGNSLAVAIKAFEQAMNMAGAQLNQRSYWGWFTEDQITDSNEVSPTAKAVLPSVLACVEKE